MLLNAYECENIEFQRHSLRVPFCRINSGHIPLQIIFACFLCFSDILPHFSFFYVTHDAIPMQYHATRKYRVENDRIHWEFVSRRFISKGYGYLEMVHNTARYLVLVPFIWSRSRDPLIPFGFGVCNLRALTRSTGWEKALNPSSGFSSFHQYSVNTLKSGICRNI